VDVLSLSQLPQQPQQHLLNTPQDLGRFPLESRLSMFLSSLVAAVVAAQTDVASMLALVVAAEWLSHPTSP
jgi:hypothetical protein